MDYTRAEKVREKAKRKMDRKRSARAVDVREVAIQRSLYKPKPSLEQRVKECLVGSTHPRDQDDYLPFALQVVERCPKLLDRAWSGPLHALYLATIYASSVSDLKLWEPYGKSAQSGFYSLAKHLLAKYPQPVLLWNALQEPAPISVKLAPFVAHVAQGGSVFKAVPDLLPVPLTRKQCHELLKASADLGFLYTVRLQQVEAHGGSKRLARLWRSTTNGGDLGTKQDEIFWDGVLAFFCKAGMFDLNQVKPLLDYIEYRRRGNRDFSMKGRTMMALLRDMEEWHKELADHRRAQARAPEKDVNFFPSGFNRMTIDLSKKSEYGNKIIEKAVYDVFEILSSRELRDEGTAMRHCVYSYRSSIEQKRISIWSMVGHVDKGSFRELTIEVNNQSRMITQARAVCNGRGDSRAIRAMQTWAIKNGITIGTHL
jgi:hypothetical protein